MGKSHYVLIRSKTRLLGDQTKRNAAYYNCDYCLHSFIRQDLLNNHMEDCKKILLKNHFAKGGGEFCFI